MPDPEPYGDIPAFTIGGVPTCAVTADYTLESDEFPVYFANANNVTLFDNGDFSEFYVDVKYAVIWLIPESIANGSPYTMKVAFAEGDVVNDSHDVLNNGDPPHIKAISDLSRLDDSGDAIYFTKPAWSYDEPGSVPAVITRDTGLELVDTDDIETDLWGFLPPDLTDIGGGVPASRFIIWAATSVGLGYRLPLVNYTGFGSDLLEDRAKYNALFGKGNPSNIFAGLSDNGGVYWNFWVAEVSGGTYVWQAWELIIWKLNKNGTPTTLRKIHKFRYTVGGVENILDETEYSEVLSRSAMYMVPVTTKTSIVLTDKQNAYPRVVFTTSGAFLGYAEEGDGPSSTHFYDGRSVWMHNDYESATPTYYIGDNLGVEDAVTILGDDEWVQQDPVFFGRDFINTDLRMCPGSGEKKFGSEPHNGNALAQRGRWGPEYILDDNNDVVYFEKGKTYHPAYRVMIFSYNPGDIPLYKEGLHNLGVIMDRWYPYGKSVWVSAGEIFAVGQIAGEVYNNFYEDSPRLENFWAYLAIFDIETGQRYASIYIKAPYDVTQFTPNSPETYTDGLQHYVPHAFMPDQMYADQTIL